MSLWIFGYGSLIWRPDFPFLEGRRAALSGWQRRLDQGSPDHRGTPEQLGRVATLVRAEAATLTWGAAFRVADADREAVLALLDHRERGGYVRLETTITVADDAQAQTVSVSALTWIAADDNPYHLGPAPLDVMVRQIAVAEGPSGANRDYVLRLAEALRQLEIHDEHVFAIAAALG